MPAEEPEADGTPDIADVDRTGGGTVYTEVPPEGEDPSRDQSLTPDVPTVQPPPVLTSPGEPVLVDPPAELADDELPAEAEESATSPVRLDVADEDDVKDDVEDDLADDDDDEDDAVEDEDDAVEDEDDAVEDEDDAVEDAVEDDDGFDAFAPAAQEPSPQLLELAKAYGVQTEFHDWQGKHSPVSRRTIVAVLRGLDVDASTDDAVERALVEVAERPWRQVLPPLVVVREGSAAQVPVHVPHGNAGAGLGGPRGGRPPGPRAGGTGRRAPHDRRRRGRARPPSRCPADLPLGWHRLHAPGTRAARRSARSSSPLTRLELPAALQARPGLGLHDPAVLGALAVLLGSGRSGGPRRDRRLERPRRTARGSCW